MDTPMGINAKLLPHKDLDNPGEDVNDWLKN